MLTDAETTENWKTQFAAYILSGSIFKFVLRYHKPKDSRSKNIINAIITCRVKDVENVIFCRSKSPLPNANAINLFVPVLRILFNTVNIPTKPPTKV